MKNILFLALISLFLINCTQESSDELAIISDVPISTRASGSEIDWLIDFQTHLRNLRDNQSTSASYTNDELAYGIEALLNLKYGDHVEGIDKILHRKESRLSITDTDYDVFTEIRNILLDDVSDVDADPDLELYFFDVDVEIDATELVINTTSVAKRTDVCSIQKYDNNLGCEVDCNTSVFEQDESYYVGLGGAGAYGDPPDSYPLLSIMCPNECGTTPACNVPVTNAFEELEAHINATNCEVECPSGMIWDGTYTNITTFYGVVEWSWGDVNSTEGPLFEDCLNDFNLFACDCLTSDILNCIYSTLCEARQNLVYPFSINIPAGSMLINTNFGVDYIPNGSGDPNTFHTGFWVSNTYAQPNCVPMLVGEIQVHVLEMDLNNWR